MTATESQSAPPPFGAGPASAGQDVFDEGLNRELARIAFPDFWFSQLTHRRLPSRWVATCKDDATTGLYAVVTADLNVLTAVLTLDQAWRIGHGMPGAQR